jgi:hypothetical protein
LERPHPEAVWTSERLHWQGQPASRRKGEAQLPIPDAEVHLAGRTIAIEVELTAKTEERWQEILAERAARYDQVWYFTLARLHRDLGRALDAVEPGVRATFSHSLATRAASAWCCKRASAVWFLQRPLRIAGGVQSTSVRWHRALPLPSARCLGGSEGSSMSGISQMPDREAMLGIWEGPDSSEHCRGVLSVDGTVPSTEPAG